MHFMIDLETLSTATDAAIIQIAICPFDMENHWLDQDGILIHVDPQSSIDAGLRVDWGAINWWMKQSDRERSGLDASGEAFSLKDAMNYVSNFLLARVGYRKEKIFVWSHGTAFDIAILENAFRVMRMEAPWDYRNVQDVRTLIMLTGKRGEKIHSKSKHNALADAEAQALWVMDMRKFIQDNLPPYINLKRTSGKKQ